MNADNLLLLLASGIHSFFLASFIEWRFSKQKTWTLICIFTVVLGMVHLPVFSISSQVSGLLSWGVPFFICFGYLSKYRDMRFVFCFTSEAVFLCCIFTLGRHLCLFFTEDNPFLNFLFTSALELLTGGLLWGSMRNILLYIMRKKKRGWGRLCVYPIMLLAGAAGFTVLDAFSPELFHQASAPHGFLVIFLVICSIFFVYRVILKLFETYECLWDSQEQERLLRLQSQALAQECQTHVQEEENLRIYRHDLRHHITALTLMLRNGHSQKALDYLEHHTQRLNELQVNPYCPDPAINAVLSFYFKQAEKAGITVQKNIQLPGPLPVPWEDFTVVLANVLENALTAVQELSPNQKEIKLILRNTKNGIALEIKNPYQETVLINEMGIPYPPLSRQGQAQEHGYGLRSVLAFKEKYHALMDIHAEHGIFQFRLYVNDRKKESKKKFTKV